ncbi:MAG: type II toxin-antitoxin system prevent-host-death family antitoxin [bacterium]|nr:type II toxin-antitoxin system prevent-host-death family antitoxin [bacterium]
MEFNELIKIMESGGGVVIVEKGSPVAVLLRYEEYKRLQGGGPKPQEAPLVREEDPFEGSRELTIDDLPL